jgi:hypothetical protein
MIKLIIHQDKSFRCDNRHQEIFYGRIVLYNLGFCVLNFGLLILDLVLDLGNLVVDR